MVTRTVALASLLLGLTFGAAASIVGGEEDLKKDPTVASSAQEPVVEVYDIHALMTPLVEFPLDTSPNAPAFVVPANRQPHANDDATSDLYREHPPAQEHLAEDLIGVIQSAISPDTWHDTGGSIGAIKETKGLLVVRQTPANQKAVAALLHKLTQERFQTVRSRAVWVLLPSADLDKLIKHSPGEGKDRESPREVDRDALEKLPASVRQFHAELLSRNGQTVHFLSGREQTVTVNQLATVGGDVSAYTPDVGNVGGGIALQINPSIDRQEKTAVLTLFSTFTDPEKPGKPIPIQSIATTQPATGERVKVSSASATYQTVGGIVQELRTTVRLPLGVPTLVGTMTLEPLAKDGPERQLGLIMTIQAGE